MKRKSRPIVNDEQLHDIIATTQTQNDQTGNGENGIKPIKRISVCPGIYVELRKSKKWEFMFRVTNNGKELHIPLGDYPEITIKQAQEKVNDFRKKFAEQRMQDANKKLDQSLKGQLRSSRRNKPGCFKDIEDATKFLKLLFLKILSLQHADQGSFEPTSFESVRLVAFALAAPNRVNDILRAKAEDFDVPPNNDLMGATGYVNWILRPSPTAKPTQSPGTHRLNEIICLPRWILPTLNLHNTQNKKGTAIFPMLSTMSPQARDIKIRKALKDIYFVQDIKISDIQSFFKSQLTQQNCFNDVFIRKLMNGGFLRDDISERLCAVVSTWWTSLFKIVHI